MAMMSNDARTGNPNTWLDLYRCMRMARRIEDVATDLARRGDASFHLGGDGHEASAVLALLLGPQDWLHPHYRDTSLILARGLPPAAYLHSLLGTAAGPTAGRDMPPFQCDPRIHLLSMATLVGNNALQSAGVAAEVRDRPGAPVVYCSLGDGGTQEGEVLEAVAECVRSRLPVLFFIEDNRFALSTPTAGRTFYNLPSGPVDSLFGVPILTVDGRDPLAVHAAVAPVIAAMRTDRAPRIVVMRCERLLSHSNSDDQTLYRSADEIARVRAEADPVAVLRRHLEAQGLRDPDFADLERRIDSDLAEALAEARRAPRPVAGAARPALPEGADRRSREARGAETGRTLSMLEAMRETLRHLLASDPAVTVSGQDIEDPKGDVFGVTRGLSTAFPGRVTNAPLSESTILGTAVGRALAGGRPVAFLQFADFFPPAYNQLAAELATIHWRSNGAYEAPVIVMAVTGGYRPGLGPCHAQSPEAAMALVPGLDVVAPSTAADAAGLLNAAFESRRPTVFLYPKALLNERRLATSPDVAAQFAPIGRARLVRTGRDITLVGWANTVGICERTADALARAGVEAEVIDLRSIAPWDRDMVAASAARTGRLIVVHEASPFCGVGAEILASVAEASTTPIALARVTGPESLLPFNADLQLEVLPSVRRVLERAAAMLDLDLRWEKPAADEPGTRTVLAAGSSPSDENIRIIRLHVKPGDTVAEGAILASVEADKAPHEIAAPSAGTVAELAAAEGEILKAGTPLMRLRVDGGAGPAAAVAEVPVLQRRSSTARTAPALHRRDERPIVISSICHTTGAREITNEELVRSYPEWKPEDVIQRTGIERRYWIGPGENALTLAVSACRKLLDREGLTIADFDAIICSTGTPLSTTPSLACRILKDLNPPGGSVQMQAHDVNAACTGYLYALQQAHDMLQHDPDARILLVTSETLSPMLDHSDPGTLFLFGDAATASLISRESRPGGFNLRVSRPVLSALGEEEKVLYVPAINTGAHIEMDGKRVFRVAIRKMIDMLEGACAADGLSINDLSMIVPHQANERIIEAIQKAIKFPTEKVFYFIRDYGNTSSNTIPLALSALIPGQPAGYKVGLTAFGGGFTFGAAILEVL